MGEYDRFQEAAENEIARLEQALEDCQAASGNMDSAMHADTLELRVREQAAEIERLRAALVESTHILTLGDQRLMPPYIKERIEANRALLNGENEGGE